MPACTRRRRLHVTAAAAILTAGCAISTEAGPIWSSKALTPKGAAAVCLHDYELALKGSEPWLEQSARRAWLEQLAMRHRPCANGRKIHVTVADIRVQDKTDAFGFPANENANSGRPQRVRVTASARATITGCRDNAATTVDLEHAVWVPYLNDPFLREERIMSVVDDLVAANAANLDTALLRDACGRARS